MRDERRLERDDAAAAPSSASRTSSATRITASLRAARSSARRPRARAPARRRGSRRRARRRRRSCRRPSTATAGWSTPSTVSAARAALQTQRASSRPDARRARARWRRRGRARASRSRARKASSTSVHVETSSETARPARTREPPARSAAVGERVAEQRVAGDVQHVAIEPRGLELVRRRARPPRRGRTPSSGRRPRRCETTTPVRPPTGPTTLDAVRRAAPARRARPPRRRRACRRSARRRRARGPRGDVRGLPAGARARGRDLVVAGHERLLELARSRRGGGRRGSSAARVGSSHGQSRAAQRQASLVRDRRPRRRRRRGRDRPPCVAALAAPRDAPAGLAAFEDAPCFLEIVGEEAQRYREGGGDTVAGTSNPT